MKKRILVTFVLSLLLSGVQQISAQAADALVNGTFSSSGGGWSDASYSGSGNAACPSGQPNIGTWGANALSFSYAKNTVYQDVVISKPSTVKLTFTVQNRFDQTVTNWFSADLGSVSTGNFTPTTTPQAVSLSFTTTTANQTVRVSFTGQDGSFWAGCYGSQVTNAYLSFPAPAAVVEPEKIFLPNDLLATTAPTFTRIGDYISCTLGNYGYRDARNSTGPITAKDLDSATVLLRNGTEVIGSASTDAYVNYPRSLLGIKDSAIDVKITGGAANWKLSGVDAKAELSCQILAYKEHQITYTTVK
jgi:hypothetical protein